jgi:hypothetical protein
MSEHRFLSLSDHALPCRAASDERFVSRRRGRKAHLPTVLVQREDNAARPIIPLTMKVVSPSWKLQSRMLRMSASPMRSRLLLISVTRSQRRFTDDRFCTLARTQLRLFHDDGFGHLRTPLLVSE